MRRMVIINFFLLLIFGFVVPGFFVVYSFYIIVGDLKGAPYVPTSDKILDEILAKVTLKKGQKFLELGSGDGRMVRRAVREFGVRGIGVEINPMLVWYARMLAKMQKLNGVRFIRGDLFKADFSQADLIFLFLMPKTNKKLAQKFLDECQKGALIVSHGFEIKELAKKMFDKQDRKLFSTYFYRV